MKSTCYRLRCHSCSIVPCFERPNQGSLSLNLPEPLNIVKYFAIRLPLYILWNNGTLVLKVVKKPLKSTTCLCSSKWNIAEQLEQNTFVLTCTTFVLHVACLCIIIIISLLLSLKVINKIKTKKKPTEVGWFNQLPDHLLTAVNTACNALAVSTMSKSASVAFSHFLIKSAICS